MGGIMPAEILACAAIADRLGFSSEAGRALVDRLWPWSRRASNRKAGVAVDLAERQMVIARDDPSVVAPLMARIETLESELAKVEAAAAVHRADFELERQRCERLMAEVLKATAELMAAREATARIAGEFAAPSRRGRGGAAWPAEASSGVGTDAVQRIKVEMRPGRVRWAGSHRLPGDWRCFRVQRGVA
jgi:hypothetical protein